MTVLSEVFELVVRSGCISRIRSGTRLETMLQYEEERDPKKKQKFETIMEELSNVCCTEACIASKLFTQKVHLILFTKSV